jgi:uncharacterized OsmC-like protein
MKRMNNVDMDKVIAFGEEIKKNPSKARKTQVLEGEWNVKEGQVQFHSSIQYEGGKTTFEADNPTFMGGGGTLPGPMHYCFFGLASCYTGVFATMATMLGIELKQVKTRVEADLNFSRMVGLGDQPPMEEVRVKLTIVSDAPPEKIKEAEELAQQRCPVVYTMRNIVKLTPTLEILKEK